MPKITQIMVFDRLRTLLDPELGVNLVDLGLIYEVRVNHEAELNKIYVKMTLTSPGCPLATVFEPMIRSALHDLVEDSEEDITVELTFDPPWTPDMMDEAVRLELGL